MSHTSTYTTRIRQVDADLLSRAVEMVAGQPKMQLARQVTTRYDSKHFAFALQPEGQYCQLGLGVRVGEDGGLEFGRESMDRHLTTWLDQQQGQVLKSYASLLVLQAAAACGYVLAGAEESPTGQPNRLTLRLS